MFQILIVDDEPSVVDAIAQTMPWDELHIDEVYCAYSSREALKIAELHYIDIVLTDIRMPGMDGMALIEAIRRTSERTRFILLTGYAEFEYAKQALKLQADDYLLKPVSDEKLQESIANVTRKLKEEWDQVTSMQRTMRVFREHLPAMRAELLRDILENRYSVRDLADKLPALNLNVQSGDTVAPMLIRLEGKFASYNRHDRFMIEYAILNIAEEIMGPHFSLWMCEDAHGYLVIAVTAKTAAEMNRTPLETGISAAATGNGCRNFPNCPSWRNRRGMMKALHWTEGRTAPSPGAKTAVPATPSGRSLRNGTNPGVSAVCLRTCP